MNSPSSSQPPLWLAMVWHGIRSCPMLKYSDRRVCAPHNRSAGASTAPRLSYSVRSSVVRLASLLAEREEASPTLRVKLATLVFMGDQPGARRSAASGMSSR